MITARERARAALATASQLPFRLLDLPAEIVGSVCDRLEDADLLNVRCACRALSAHSANAFGKRFFNHLIVLLHPTSLTTLLEICHHTVLSKHVRKITVSGERIGQSIRGIGQEKLHKDLQVNVERSGMDFLTLTEAFRELENLEMVQVDVISFYHVEQEPVDAGIRCGLTHIIPSKLFNPPGSCERHGDSGKNRVYDLIPEALLDAGVHDKVGLQFEFWNTDYSNEDVVTFLDLDCEIWKSQLSRQVHSVSVLGQVDRGWLCRLLSATSSLRKFEFGADNHFMELSYQPVGPFHWPGFSHLHLEDVFFSHTDWTNFLRTHAGTLRSLSCSSIGFPEGEWTEPLQIIETMPQIEYLWLVKLLEKAPYPHSSMSVRRWSPEDDGVLRLFDPEEVQLALSAMRSQPRTVFMGAGIRSEAGEVYSHRVSFDVGEAALARDIVCQNGEWTFADTFPEG
ncbi:hypothetical protein J4E93_008800 [Alternaria ventricosa]|uniref:uncharacterized protein n=1 Tax=Alternaria ventricosa TaxID=1187951 RepID=UPI0020C323DF|nr:uncharacterized protein J4E93_008800 [Alternaria ventricosa]KAI4640001.1 hypothetical protein J4E93_008800 [Alternaria ventricosa]